jgi:hypothetical protein
MLIFQAFNYNMNSKVYKNIINNHLAPYCNEKFKRKTKLHQDNDSKHASKICTQALRNVNIKWVTLIQIFKKKVN